VVCARAIGVEDGPVVGDVAGVEELVVLVTKFAFAGDEALDIVEVAELKGEVDVALVVQPGVAENDEPILDRRRASVRGQAEVARVFGVCVAPYLVASATYFLQSLIVDVAIVPIGNLNLGAKCRVDGFHRDLREGSINIQNTLTSHCGDGIGVCETKKRVVSTGQMSWTDVVFQRTRLRASRCGCLEPLIYGLAGRDVRKWVGKANPMQQCGSQYIIRA
jgi:hypothetical protein